MLLYKKKVRVIFMINAMTALNMTEEAIKFKENNWNVIDKGIKEQANACFRVYECTVYPDSPIPVKNIVEKLKELGFDVNVKKWKKLNFDLYEEVEEYDESDLNTEVGYCHDIIISW